MSLSLSAIFEGKLPGLQNPVFGKHWVIYWERDTPTFLTSNLEREKKGNKNVARHSDKIYGEIVAGFAVVLLTQLVNTSMIVTSRQVGMCNNRFLAC